MRDSKFLLFLHRILLERPDTVEEKNYPVFVPQNISTIAASLAVLTYLFVFWFLGVYPLALYQVISIAIWVYANFLCRKGFHHASLTVFSIDLIIHQALCVIFIGWDAGFQYFIFLIPLGIFVLPPERYVFKTSMVLLSGISYALLDYLSKHSVPVFPLDTITASIFHYVNLSLFISSLSIVLFYFHLNMKNAEEKLQKEHETTAAALSERNQALDHLNEELLDAADYVKRILPPPVLEGTIRTNWRFVPSTSLGGDAFGYHRVDNENLAAYLIDVSGHGVGAALLSISVINVLRSQSLPTTDFKDPAQVLKSLNLAFPSESNKDMFFTMWYGVYNENSRELIYASGGHPPALLFNGNPANGSEIDLLRTPNYVIGGMPESIFKTEKCFVGEGSMLYIYSDGVYEVEKPDGAMWRFQEFTDYLQQVRTDNGSVLDRLYEHVKDLGNSETLEDDFTILEVAFT